MPNSEGGTIERVAFDPEGEHTEEKEATKIGIGGDRSRKAKGATRTSTWSRGGCGDTGRCGIRGEKRTSFLRSDG